ncbi:MAG: response regulator transcription factor [Rhizobacter sp.]|nr:response regulator transcription factor [Chlorobiales bacterium]
MVKLRTLIVDDEPLALERLRSLLAAEPDIDLVGQCASGEDAIEVMRQHEPDLVFLDVQMPELTGFDVVKSLRGGEAVSEALPVIVFVTASAQHAVEAFNVCAADYLLKPFDRSRLQESLRRARSRINQHRTGEANNQINDQLTALINTAARSQVSEEKHRSEMHIKRIAVKASGRVFFVKTEDIDWIEAADNYVCLHVGSKSHLVRETLSNIESQLGATLFARIHRGAIVNLERIKELHPHFHGEHVVILHNGTRLMLSRNYRHNLPHLLGKNF